jgi:hypothetical protein
LASPALTGNVTITTNSASPALVIVQDGAGDVVQFKDVAADTTYSFINASGKVSTIASASANAGLNIPHGAAPTSPVNGDIWTTSASGLAVRINGATQTMATTTELGSYLTTATAASTYLTPGTASSTYLPLAGGTLTGNLYFSSSYSIYTNVIASLTDYNFVVQTFNSTSPGTYYNHTFNNADGRLLLPTNGGGLTFPDSTTQTTAGIPDAPSDGDEYVRLDGAWAIATGGGGGGLTISDLSNAATSTLNATAPTSGQSLTYDGTDLIWATVSGGGGLTISTLSNAATSTLNATAPTSGQSLTYDGTDLIWATVGGSYLPLAGGTMTGGIVFDAVGGQSIDKGTFDSSRYGYNGISLKCAVGFELNWQAGWLTANQFLGTPSIVPIYIDSGAGTTLNVWEGTTSTGIEISHTEITFPDLTTQSTAAIADAPSDGKAYSRKDATWVYDRINAYDSAITYQVGDQVTYNSTIYQLTTSLGGAGYDPATYISNWTPMNAGSTGAAGANGTNGASGAMNYLDMLTVTSSANPAYYESGGTWSVYYGFMNTSAGWFYNKLNASGVDFKLYINGTYDSTDNAAYNYYYSSGTLVGSPASGDVVTIFLSDGAAEATIPLVTYTY